MQDLSIGLVARFFAQGQPRSKGSLKVITPRGRRPILAEQGEHSKAWRTVIRNAILTQVNFRHTAYPGPVEVRAVFFFQRTTGVNGEVWPSHDTPYPTDRNLGDLDKLERNLLDALTDSGLIADDAQVVTLRSEKRWTAPNSVPGVQVHVLTAPAGEPVTEGIPASCVMPWGVA